MSALLTSATLNEAAEISGISIRTLYNLRSDPAFSSELNQRRRQMVETACGSLQTKFAEASKTLAELMEDTGLNPAVRLNAAKAILEYGLKTIETLDILPRLAALEEAERRRSE